MNEWQSNVEQIATCLNRLSVRDGDQSQMDVEGSFTLVTDLIYSLRETHNTIYLIGNGASASMASHISADLAKNVLVHTETFTDLSLITAIGNDIGYHEVFAEPLRRRMRPGDMLIAVSSSGRSPNIVHAANTASYLGGDVITITAMGEDNPLRRAGMLNFYVPAQTYGLAESCHAAILHHFVDRTAELIRYREEVEKAISMTSPTTLTDLDQVACR